MSGRVSQVTRVGAAALAVAAGAGGVWVVNGTSDVVPGGYPEDDSVWRVDPRSGRVLARIPVRAPTAVTLAAGAVWVYGTVTRTLFRIDPRRNRVVARVRLPGGELLALAGDARGVWAADAAAAQPRSSLLVRIDARTSRVRATRSLPYRVRGLAVSGATVWLTGAGPARALVARIDARTARPAGSPIAVAEALGVAATPRAVWVTGGDGTIARVDPAHGRVAGRTKLARYADAVQLLGSDVWVSDFNEQTIVRLRPF